MDSVGRTADVVLAPATNYIYYTAMMSCITECIGLPDSRPAYQQPSPNSLSVPFSASITLLEQPAMFFSFRHAPESQCARKRENRTPEFI